MLDKALIGRVLESITVNVEKGQLKFFAKATREKNPIYFDESAAKAAGHPSIPAPPTFAFSLSLAHPDPFAWLIALGVDLGKVLHGQQKFEYANGLIYAGDVITLQGRIADIYEKKNGALQFIVTEYQVTNQRNENLGKMICNSAIRNS